MQRTKVGFIGLGNQGAPIAHRILAAGWPLHVWARRPESLTEFTAKGAVGCATPGDLAAACEIVEVCVRTDDDVRDVMFRADGVLAGIRPGSVLLLHSTLSPETVAEVAKAGEAQGVKVLDAPVSGGPTGAAAGTMTVLVGGDAAALERARPILESFADTIPLLGPVGSGQLLKLVNNSLCYSAAAMSISALELAEQLGMDVKVAAEVMKVSSGGSHGLDILVAQASRDKMRSPTSNLRKDVGHLVEVLAERGIASSPLTDVSATLADRIIEYGGKLDAIQQR